MFPIVKDKRRDVAITCFAMIDHTEKRTIGIVDFFFHDLKMIVSANRE